jgi:hypothetical protein
MIKIISKNTEKLTNKDVVQICLLKKSEWKKYSIKSQLHFFKKNYKKKDLHNCIYIGKSLVGYNSLKKRSIRVKSKNINYFIFDSLVVKKSKRNLKLSYEIMMLSNKIINKDKKISFLMCTEKLVNFYKKYNWKEINKKKFKIVDLKSNSTGMNFNEGIKDFNNLEKPVNIYLKK